MDSDSIKQFVANVLRIPDSLNVYWDIIDTYPKATLENPEVVPQLALAHYNDTYNVFNRSHAPLRNVRGTIVDLNTGAIVADSYGYSETLPCNEPLSEFNSADTSVLRIDTELFKYLNTVERAPDEMPKETIGIREFDLSTIKLFLGYEGALIRLFKWNDQVFFSTHRRIDARKSHWGGRTPFYQLFEQLNGPEVVDEEGNPLGQQLFGEEAYSPFCHMFLLVHNDIRLATSTRDNRIVYLGVKKVWDEEVYAKEGGPYHSTEPFDLILPKFGSEESPFDTNENRSMIMQPSVSVDMANKFLFPSEFATPMPKNYVATDHELVVKYGDFGVEDVYCKNEKVSDERLSGGDFIMLYTKSSSGELIVYRLEPRAYKYRSTIMGNDPNFYHRFVTEMPKFTKGDVKTLQSEYPRYNGQDGKELSLEDPINRQVYWWSIFYDAIHPTGKDQVQEFFKRYEKDVMAVAGFILDTYPKLVAEHNEVTARGPILGTVEHVDVLGRVTEQTQKRFEDLRRVGQGGSRHYHKFSPRTVIRNLLYNETGPSLYKMITTMNMVNKMLAQKPVVATG